MQACKKHVPLCHSVLLASGSLHHLQTQRTYLTAGEGDFVQQV